MTNKQKEDFILAVIATPFIVVGLMVLLHMGLSAWEKEDDARVKRVQELRAEAVE